MKLGRTIHSLPWLAMAAFGFFMLSDIEPAMASLKYGLLKAAVAVIIAWVADRSLFPHSLPREHTAKGQYMPEIRRAIVFFSVCMLMQMV